MLQKSVLYIFEGMDNTGKDTQISLLTNAILKKNKSLTISDFSTVHWGPPVGNSDDEKRINFIANTKFQFERIVNEPPKIYMWNRSYLGEYVYGRMYRNTNPDSWLLSLEKEMLQNLDQLNAVSGVYLIHLDGLPEHLIYADDGFSYSINNSDKENERFLFIDVVNISSIPHKFSINVSSSRTSYVNLNLINHNILSFLYYKNDKTIRI